MGWGSSSRSGFKWKTIASINGSVRSKTARDVTSQFPKTTARSILSQGKPIVGREKSRFKSKTIFSSTVSSKSSPEAKAEKVLRKVGLIMGDDERQRGQSRACLLSYSAPKPELARSHMLGFYDICDTQNEKGALRNSSENICPKHSSEISWSRLCVVFYASDLVGFR